MDLRSGNFSDNLKDVTILDMCWGPEQLYDERADGRMMNSSTEVR